MTNSTPTERLKGWLDGFAGALSAGAGNAVARHFTDDCFWRDLVSFTWNIKTFESPTEIAAMVDAVVTAVAPHNWALDGEATEANGVCEGWITFDTAVARGRGHVRLKGDKCWTLLTTMTELKGHEEKKGRRREKGAIHGTVRGRKSWLELKTEREARLGYEDQPYCVVVGGGQGGIGLGARLRRLGIPTLIIESNPRAGDSWRNRYRSLCLHDPVWYDHMPYIKFPEN
ncbi:MAG: NAD(P)/FAD-dependent oxidoreductase, partial [Rhodospirillales bacterium]|nr:NAD(P)/FAD-dependent oxidoreductase [Rhodospirillales bacterium]